MAIDLLNRLAQTQVNADVSKKAADAVKNADSVLAAKILKTVLSLRTGDTLQGELVSVNGRDISLLLEDTVLLNAKMDKELMLTLGQKMSFTVDSNQNGKLSLKPLFANTGMEQNAMKALEAANIPVTDRSLALTEEMMRRGMPVNKSELGYMCRQMGMYPDAVLEDLVMLKKMDIPITEENISMMRLYQTGRQYLFSDLHPLSDQTAELFIEIQKEQPGQLKQDLVRIFGDTLTDTVDFSQKEDHVGEYANMEEGMSYPKNETDAAVSGRLSSDDPTADDKIPVKENAAGSSDTVSLHAQDVKTDVSLDKLEHLVKEAALGKDGAKEELARNIFSLLKEQFLMKPETMNMSEYVKRFYEHLGEQVDKLQKIIKSAGKEDTPLGKEVGTIKSNLQFMSQINEMYHYVQLPLKMNDGETNGDLYVYKKKKAKTGDDGKLTALLHLSMPCLGNMDIFLSLEGEKLSTRFCMEKEEMIDFMEENMDRLNERLIKRGYHVMTTVTAAAKEEEKSVIEEVMTTESEIPFMTSQSFDARC